jgi:hypothetical protein
MSSATRSSRSGGEQGAGAAAGDGGGGGGAAAGARGPRQDRLHLALPHGPHLLAHEGTDAYNPRRPSVGSLLDSWTSSRISILRYW